MTTKVAVVEVLRTEGAISVLPGSSGITPVALAIASTPEREDNADEAPPVWQKAAVQRLELMDGET
jgi:hypothetical protein